MEHKSDKALEDTSGSTNQLSFYPRSLTPHHSKLRNLALLDDANLVGRSKLKIDFDYFAIIPVICWSWLHSNKAKICINLDWSIWLRNLLSLKNLVLTLLQYLPLDYLLNNTPQNLWLTRTLRPCSIGLNDLWNSKEGEMENAPKGKITVSITWIETTKEGVNFKYFL